MKVQSQSNLQVRPPLVTGNHFSKHQKFSRGFCDTFKAAPDTMVQSLNSLNIYHATQSIKKNFKKQNGFTVNILYPRNCNQLILSKKWMCPDVSLDSCSLTLVSDLVAYGRLYRIFFSFIIEVFTTRSE